MKIKPYPKNAKRHPDKQLKQIANSIKEFGWQQPIVVDKDGVIIAGHGRWFAYEKYKDEMNLSKPEIKVASNLTKQQVRAYRLADNKLNESDWDMELAIEELKELDDKMFDLTGFDKDIIIGVQEDNFNAQEEYDKIKEPTAKLGELYQLGKNRLLCEDSTKVENFEKLMNKELAQVIFTDPPYNVSYDYWGFRGTRKHGIKSKKVFNDKKTDEEFIDFITKSFQNGFNFTTKESTFYCWHSSSNENLFRQGLKNAGWYISQTIIWLKPSLTFSPGQDYHRIYEPCYYGWKKKEKRYVNKDFGNFTELLMIDNEKFENMLEVWKLKRDNTRDYKHPTQKPIKLAERALKYHSKENDIILEMFNGSGSTMMACEQMNRKCYAIELDPKFVDVAIKRWEQFTNEKAIKIK